MAGPTYTGKAKFKQASNAAIGLKKSRAAAAPFLKGTDHTEAGLHRVGTSGNTYVNKKTGVTYARAAGGFKPVLKGKTTAQAAPARKPKAKVGLGKYNAGYSAGGKM